MQIRDWPPAERPREKLLQLGSGALSEAELLAIWLRHGTSGMNALDLARSLLTRFGSLRSVLTAGCRELCGHSGVGPARWAELQAALEIVRRHHLERLQSGPVLGSPRAARDYLIARLRDLQHEVFCCLFLDSRHRLTRCEELFRGTVDGPNRAIDEPEAEYGYSLSLQPGPGSLPGPFSFWHRPRHAAPSKSLQLRPLLLPGAGQGRQPAPADRGRRAVRGS